MIVAAGDQPVPLTRPPDGVPDVTDTAAALAAVVAAFAAGTGPVAVDAERAGSYRYSQRAYLVQLRRAGAGTALVDPVALPDLRALGAALAGTEWVLHAASQDLACLAEVGLVPDRLFDTELAGRLTGHARVGLGALTEEILGLILEKGHAAADWSRRPLPEAWLTYAALDVEVLVRLRGELAAELAEQGKSEWAAQEFEAVRRAAPPPPRAEPWRRTSGIHTVRDRRRLAALRAAWEVRDDRARQEDIAPGRLLPDTAILAAATAAPASRDELMALPRWTGRGARRLAAPVVRAVQAARDLPESELPTTMPPSDALPPVARWSERNPDAADRLRRARAAVHQVADAVGIPVENLVPPETVRRLAWDPPVVVEPASVASALAAGGARAWQVDAVADVLTAAVASDSGSPADEGSRSAAEGLQAGPEGARPVAEDGSRRIVTEHLVLVPVRLDVARAMLAGEPTGLSYGAGFPHSDTPDQLRANLDRGDPDGTGWFVTLRDTGEVIGDAGWHGPPDPDGVVEIGYGLAAPYRGRGFGTEAVTALVDWLDRHPGVRELRADAIADNRRSRAVLERLGFTIERLDGAWVHYVRPARKA